MRGKQDVFFSFQKTPGTPLSCKTGVQASKGKDYQRKAKAGSARWEKEERRRGTRDMKEEERKQENGRAMPWGRKK